MNEYDELLKGTTKPRNEYDSLIGQQQQTEQSALRASFAQANATTPDRAAQVIKLSERTKLPPNVVERNFDDLVKKYDLSDNEYDTMLRENPKLSKWLMDTSNAAIARDELPLYSRIENSLKSFGRGWEKASIQSELADVLYKELNDTLTPQERARRDKLKGDLKYLSEQDDANGVPEYASGVTGYSARQMGSVLFEGARGTAAGGVVGAAAGTFIPGVGNIAGGTAGMIAGGATAMTNYAYRMESAFAYDALRDMRDINDNPIDPSIAKNVARGVGVVNALIEGGSDVLLASLIPGFGNLVGGLGGSAAKNAVRQAAMDALKVPTKRAALMSALGKMGGAASVEGVEEFVQNLVNAGGREIAQAASGQQFKPDDFRDDVLQGAREALDAAVGTFFTFAPVGGARFYQLHRQAQKAQQQAEFFNALGDGVSTSKTFARLPQKMQDFIAAATKDGPVENVYVPVESWRTYWQNQNIDPAIAAEQAFGSSTLYEGAIQSGEDMVIPMARFATNIAATEHGKFFANEARLAPDEMNAREATELQARLDAEQKAAEEARAKAREQAQQPGSVDEVMTRLREDVKSKLIAAGVEQKTAEEYAAIQEARFRQFADRAGISAEALFERFVKGDKLQVGIGDQQGEVQQMMSQGRQFNDEEKYHGAVPEIKYLPLSAIHRQEMDFRPEVMSVSDEVAAGMDYSQPIEATAFRFGPNNDDTQPIVTLTDGHHRTAAALQTGRAYLPVSIKAINATGKKLRALVEMSQEIERTLNQPAVTGDTISVDGQDRPTTNSKGQPIATTVEALTNFWRWFGDSKVVDQQGRPMVVYHGTDAVFDEFDPIGNENAWVSAEYPSGSIFLTSSEPRAKAYGSRVMALYLRAEKVAKFDAPMSPDKHIDERPELFKKLESGRVDAVRVDGSDRDGGRVTTYVTLDPSSIKSAIGNLGTFDPLSASILNQSSAAAQTETPEFKAWFGDSKVVDADGKPLVVYHGTARPDRVGNKFKASRATSGPMAYFTDDPQIASNYAAGKNDTSMSGDELHYEQWFQYVPKGARSPRSITFKWYEMSQQEREHFHDMLRRIRENEETGEVEDGGERGGISPDTYDWDLKQKHGNGISAAIELWLTSGSIYNEEEKFLKIMKMAGVDMKGVDYIPQNEAMSAVYPVYLAIQNPLVTSTIDDSVIAKLEAASRKARGPRKPELSSGDPWDKRNRYSPAEWINTLKEDQAKGANSFVWTSIPDWVTRALVSMGYDGIQDTGGKMGGEGHDVWVPFSSSQIKSAVGNRGTFDPNSDNILHQPPEQDAKRGSITFTNGADRRFKIDLLEGADLSTFIHESGHFWLETLGDVVQELRVGDASKLSDKQRKMVEDYDAILKWMGVKSRAEIEVKHHEQFARAIEAYFMEGNAPSAELRGLFARVRSWMIAIYQSITKLNVTLTPEVREVFDRMIASDAEIEAAQSEGNVSAMFTTANDAGMSDIEFAAYKDRVQKASDTARAELAAKVLKTVTREREKWWKQEREKVRAEIAEEVYARPEQIALSVLTRDVMPNGDALPYDLQRVKMNRAEIDAMYGEGAWKTLPRGSTEQGGLALSAVADLFGYKSGDELVKAVRQAKPANAVIDAETDSRMKQEHGDALIDGSIHEEARAAVQSEERVAVVKAELRALARLAAASKPAVQAERKAEAQRTAEGVETIRSAVPTKEATGTTKDGDGNVRQWRALVPNTAIIRAMAEGRIAQSKVRDVNPHTYLVAARKASMRAVELAASKDYVAAATAKQRELLNIELYRAAIAAREEIEKTVDYMQTFAEGKKRARIAKAGQDYLDQIDGFLDRYEFAPVSQKALDRRAALAQWVAAKERAGEPVNLPPGVEVETRTNYKDMHVEELRGVRDSVKMIEHMAKLKNRLLTSKAKRDLAEVTGDIAESIRENARSVRGPKIESRLPKDEALRLVDTWFSMHRKIASMIREMDGLKDGGLLWEYVMRPINAAADQEATMNADATKKLQKLFEVYAGKESSKLYVKQVVPEVGSLSKMARLMVALNWGNEDNRQKIMDGYGWTNVQIDSILNTLDERDWKFVQGVWDFIDSYWPEIEAKQKRVEGVAPDKVARSPVMTKFGEMPGGYFPLKYDDRQDAASHGNRIEEAAEAMMRGGYTSSTTQRGHTKGRVEGVRRPIRLDFGVIFEHVGQVVHDLSHHEMLIDVTRILRSKTVSGEIINTYGDVTYKQLQNALVDIAAGDIPAVGAFEKSINYVRQGATITGLGWNLMTSLLQPLGLAQSMVRVGPKWIGKGLSRWIGDAASLENTAAWIQDKSEFMSNRMRTQQREINEIRNQVGVNTGRFSGWIDQAMRGVSANTVTKQGIVDSYFWLIAKAQQIADIPTWLGAYEKAMADPSIGEERAIALADQAVIDTQGGGQMKDMAAIQRGGPLLKIWTNFYSYFNVTYNLSVESLKGVRLNNPITIGRTAVDFLLLYTLPATLGTLMKSALKGDDDDADKMVERLIRDNLSYVFGVMVGLREIGSVVQGYGGYEGPAGARFFSTIGKLMKQTEQGEADAAFWKTLNDTAGILLHYPAGQVRRSAEGLAALIEGDTVRPTALIFGAPKQ